MSNDQRGALDGLATVAPVGDPDYAGLHGSIALTSEGPRARIPLDSSLPCIPQCRNSRGCSGKRAAVIHAVSTPYRDRSHFDGQDVLESGFAGPGRMQSGWLNRALEGLPKGDKVIGGLAIGADHAAGAEGRGTDRGLGTCSFADANDDTAERLLDLYHHHDPALAMALSQGLQLDKAALGESPRRRATHQPCGDDAAGRARRCQTDGGR